MNVAWTGASEVIDKSSCRDGEMVQLLRIHTAVAVDWSLAFSTYVGQLRILVSLAARAPTHRHTET